MDLTTVRKARLGEGSGYEIDAESGFAGDGGGEKIRRALPGNVFARQPRHSEPSTVILLRDNLFGGNAGFVTGGS